MKRLILMASNTDERDEEKNCRHDYSHCSECCDREHDELYKRLTALREENERLRARVAELEIETNRQW